MGHCEPLRGCSNELLMLLWELMHEGLFKELQETAQCDQHMTKQMSA